MELIRVQCFVPFRGAPGYENLGNYWFSTDIDPIAETGDSPNCFIYGYNHPGVKRLVEVIKTRIKKEKDPDYWEPSRPIRKYGMTAMPVGGVPGNKTKTRWDTISKNVVYIDFRQSLSAFDKVFYHSEVRSRQTTKDRKDYIRRMAVHLKRAITNSAANYIYRKKEKISKKNVSLTKSQIESVSKILGRQYSEVDWIGHSFFGVDGFTCLLKMGDLNYTEAFAGSGEYAAVRLVVELTSAAPKSLILLDEPEVSLHPGAQERLIEFLADIVKVGKHQVVLSTHSPAIIRNLPPEAIKVFVLDPSTNKVNLPSQESNSSEAFFYIGEPQRDKITIVVEDELAAKMVLKSLRIGGEAFAKKFIVKHFPGGSQTLWSHYIPIFAADSRRDLFVFLDGDERPDQPLPDSSSIPSSANASVEEHLKRVSGVDIRLAVDGSRRQGSSEQRIASQRHLMDWAAVHVRYLPGDSSPEKFVWDNMTHDKNSNSVACDKDPKSMFEQLARNELGIGDYEELVSADILQTQVRRLATISEDNASIVELHSNLSELKIENR